MAKRQYQVNDYYQNRRGRRVLVRGHNRMRRDDIGQASLLSQANHERQEIAVPEGIERREVFCALGRRFDTIEEAQEFLDRNEAEKKWKEIRPLDTKETIEWFIKNAQAIIDILSIITNGENK